MTVTKAVKAVTAQEIKIRQRPLLLDHMQAPDYMQTSLVTVQEVLKY